MSNHTEWGTAKGALYQVLGGDAARVEWNLGDDIIIEGPYLLGVFNDSGDGVVLEGQAGDILHYVDLLHAHVHHELGES
jgi:hypothetical protein